MAYQLPRDSQQYVICGMKRKHPEEPSSMFKKLDWVDQVIADAAPVKPCHDAVVSKVKVEPCLQEFFTNMLKSRGYSGKTHDTLSCGYNNQPTVRQNDQVHVCIITCPNLLCLPMHRKTKYQVTA